MTSFILILESRGGVEGHAALGGSARERIQPELAPVQRRCEPLPIARVAPAAGIKPCPRDLISTSSRAPHLIGPARYLRTGAVVGSASVRFFIRG